MLARAAEKLYWMARYLERAENTARLINSTTHMLLDLPPGASFGWKNLIEVAGLDNAFHQYYPQANEEAIMRFLIEDKRNPSSILSCVHYARENTRTLREVLPAEMWERINSLYLYIRDNAACRSRRDRYMVLNNVIEQRHAIVGLVSGTMAHDLAYQMIKMGRNIERADMTTRIIDINSAVKLPQDDVLRVTTIERIWMSTLNSLSAYQSYRSMVNMRICSDEVVRFLLRDMRFPRSVEHCLSEINSCIRLMPRSQPVQQLIAQFGDSWENPDSLDAQALHRYLDNLQEKLAEIHTALADRYFNISHGDDPALNQGKLEFAGQAAAC
jgi:uncharacterized alpha-E superfamily protein